MKQCQLLFFHAFCRLLYRNVKIVNDDPPIVEGIYIFVGLHSVEPSLAAERLYFQQNR